MPKTTKTGQRTKKTTTKTKRAAETKASTLRVAPPSHAILEVKIKSVPGSTLIMESKMGAEYLKRLQGSSMDPTVKAGMLAQQPGGSATKVRNVPRTDAVLQQEYEHSLYKVAGKKDQYGLPATGFKKSMIELGKNKANDGLDGMHVTRNVWVLSDCKSTFGEELVAIKCSKPHQQLDIGKNSGKTGAPRVISRGEIDTWEATLRVKFNTNAFTAEEVLNMINRCGMEDGWGGKRVGKGHTHGEYRVADRPAPKVTELKVKKLNIK
jgi:hypothetical protein